MKASDLVVGLASVVLGLALLGYGIALPPMPGQRYGAGLFPILLGGCFALCGAIVARNGWRRHRAARVPLVALDDWARDRTLVGNLVLVLGLILVYILFSERIGFIPLSIAILLALFLRLKVRPLLSVVVAVAATAFIYAAFARLLRVPLPRGLLDGIVW